MVFNSGKQQLFFEKIYLKKEVIKVLGYIVIEVLNSNCCSRKKFLKFKSITSRLFSFLARDNSQQIWCFESNIVVAGQNNRRNIV